MDSKKLIGYGCIAAGIALAVKAKQGAGMQGVGALGFSFKHAFQNVIAKPASQVESLAAKNSVLPLKLTGKVASAIGLKPVTRIMNQAVGVQTRTLMPSNLITTPVRPTPAVGPAAESGNYQGWDWHGTPGVQYVAVPGPYTGYSAGQLVNATKENLFAAIDDLMHPRIVKTFHPVNYPIKPGYQTPGIIPQAQQAWQLPPGYQYSTGVINSWGSSQPYRGVDGFGTLGFSLKRTFKNVVARPASTVVSFAAKATVAPIKLTGSVASAIGLKPVAKSINKVAGGVTRVLTGPNQMILPSHGSSAPVSVAPASAAESGTYLGWNWNGTAGVQYVAVPASDNQYYTSGQVVDPTKAGLFAQLDKLQSDAMTYFATTAQQQTAQTPQTTSAGSGAGTSFTQPPDSSGGGGGGGGGDAGYGPSDGSGSSASATAATPDAVLPAEPPKKLNPLLIVGTLLAVPVVLGFANK